MDDNDLIRRGDALAAIQLGETVTKMQSRILAIPPVDADPVCTDCGGTGITYQTERRCACQPALTPASDGRAEGLREDDGLQAALLVLGTYLLEKGEDFRTGEGAELLDVYHTFYAILARAAELEKADD